MVWIMSDGFVLGFSELGSASGHHHRVVLIKLEGVCHRQPRGHDSA